MSVAVGQLRPHERRERKLLSSRRRTAEGRAARERTRNGRLAMVGFVALAAAITFGVRTSWAPPPARVAMNAPGDAESRRFAQSRIGRLLFNSLDDAICREMQFNNDTGQFGNEKTMRCDEGELREDSANASLTDARARADSIRSGFTSR
jgi:hypothetical protein